MEDFCSNMKIYYEIWMVQRKKLKYGLSKDIDQKKKEWFEDYNKKNRRFMHSSYKNMVFISIFTICTS